MNLRFVKLFLRISLSAGFFSAVADRFGWWNKEYSVWGNWDSFLSYTKTLNPLIPDYLINPIGVIATALEIIFAFFLLIGFKTEFFAKLSGCLLLVFGLSMVFSTGIKGALDYSVFTAAGASFALAAIKEKYCELDSLLAR